MQSLPRAVDDPMMRRLVALMQERLPSSVPQGRLHLLEQLRAFEREALERGADPGTLRSIRATQAFVRRCDPPSTSRGTGSDQL
ncbi:hypothetical protein ABID82_006239 [Methylobacterium sp. PvP062]|jgi:hypothetical protein|uniref:Uncharacterized protein n=1 Tax=Methylobacterium radiotolerans TaxID=31998 RepID=A0ABV2NSR0_9HYPH|nr:MULTISPECIES: hypothetical protein [Methylobacterium]MCX7333854.1 hypothetical protein [Hyphomicrobiales bacterium]GAN48742.1 O-antigen polymerase [Methylobacterium sp. ME121]KIU26831.1 hypothetical protein SR39_31205 [Methylobacterium radiotolerans]KZC01590.1 hypothetical protein AU375_02119 [Methylobacterium radiotolerans]MBN6819829.1 hypothetical protein [Methylobacterium organophilum]